MLGCDTCSRLAFTGSQLQVYSHNDNVELATVLLY